MKKLGVKMRPEMLVHTKQTRPELHAASPLIAELHILPGEEHWFVICEDKVPTELSH